MMRRATLPVAVMLLVGAAGELAGPAPPPIVIVPGLGGSVIKANLTNMPSYRDCATSSEDYTIWFAVSQIMTRFDCFCRNFKLEYDPVTQQVDSARGGRITPDDFGGLNGVDYMNPDTPTPETPIPYMTVLTTFLLARGYTAGVTLRAATCWRGSSRRPSCSPTTARSTC